MSDDFDPIETELRAQRGSLMPDAGMRTSDTISPAEIASLRVLLGLSQVQLAEVIGRNPRVARAWEAGDYRCGPESITRLWALKAEHDRLTRDMLEAGSVVVLPRHPDGDRPRSWYLAAAGRAMSYEPDLMVEYDTDVDDDGE